MYTVAVRRNFIAQHYLVGGDWGAENNLHLHYYQLELQLQGFELDQHGFLVDIVSIEQELDKIIAVYRDQALNELEKFVDLNPSIEHFSRILCESLSHQISSPNIKRVIVKLWEGETAWASYQVVK